MNKEMKLESPTEFLRVVEGMVRYVDKECKVDGSGKAVFCVAVDTVGASKPTIMAMSGNQDLLGRALAAVFCSGDEAKALLERVAEHLYK